MTKVEIKEVARRIANMRLSRHEKPSQSEINTRRVAVKKRLEERRFNAMLDALRDEAAA